MPEGFITSTAENGKSELPRYDFRPGKMLKTSNFYFLFILYACIMICSLMIIGHASPIGQTVAGLTSTQASTIVGLLGLFNSGGRVFWGATSDKLGRLRAVMIMCILSGTTMFSMNYLTTYWLYAIGVSIIAFCFGGAVGVFPAIVADNFGSKYVGINYGLMLLAYAVGAIIGPIMASEVIKVTGGNYSIAFIISGILCAIGAVMAMVYKVPMMQRRLAIE